MCIIILYYIIALSQILSTLQIIYIIRSTTNPSSEIVTIINYSLPLPLKVEFSGEEVIVCPLAFIASLFIYVLRSR